MFGGRTVPTDDLEILPLLFKAGPASAPLQHLNALSQPRAHAGIQLLIENLNESPLLTLVVATLWAPPSSAEPVAQKASPDVVPIAIADKNLAEQRGPSPDAD